MNEYFIKLLRGCLQKTFTYTLSKISDLFRMSFIFIQLHGLLDLPKLNWISFHEDTLKT